MAGSSREAYIEITPPIIFNEDADVQVYASVEDFVRDIEIADLLDPKSHFHDANGRVLEPRVEEGRATLVPTKRVEADSEVLKTYMVGTLRLWGVPDSQIGDKSFSELATLLLKKGSS